MVGKEDLEWGERVCAAIVLREGSALSEAELRKWGKERLAPYKAPSKVMFLESLPRNPMGKVIKAQVKDLFDCQHQLRRSHSCL